MGGNAIMNPRGSGDDGDTLRTIASSNVSATSLLSQGEYAKGFDALAVGFDAFLGWYGDQTDGWLNPVLRVMSTDLRLAAMLADKMVDKADPLQNVRTKKTVNFFERSFRAVMAKGRLTPESKKWGALHVVNTLFKLHFRLSTVRMCSTFIRSVNSPLFPPLDQFAPADRATYNFYIGKLALMEDDYEEADRALCEALRILNPAEPSHNKNRRLILQHLVPVKMCLGKTPISNYDLGAYARIAQGIEKGDLALFHRAVQESADYLVGSGLYMLVYKLEEYTLRSLIRNCYIAAGDNKVNLSRLLKSPTFMAALRASSSGACCLNEASTEEDAYAVLECMLANLIYKGLMKGYVSHERRYLVLSKKDPFP